jgi:hypothetical protein
MGHPRPGEKMSCQRLCGDVLLTLINALSVFRFRQVLSFAHQRSAAHPRGLACATGAATSPSEHHL